jgi:hypothetical protein
MGVFPAEQPLDRIEPFFEDGGIEARLAASLWGNRPFRAISGG